MKRVCVYCGSGPGRRKVYADTARHLGRSLAARGVGLVYGGGSVGLMGAVADAVLADGGEVIGVIPGALTDREVAHGGLTELRVVESMHQRKAAMAEVADGFIALPGGLGTLEELFEALTWAQLGMHRKPCGILNVAGYYDGLIAFLDQAVSEEFVGPVHREALLVEEDPDLMLEALGAWRPPAVRRWMGPEDV